MVQDVIPRGDAQEYYEGWKKQTGSVEGCRENHFKADEPGLFHLNEFQ